MYLHFECGVWCYKTEAVLQLKEDALAVIGQSQQIDLEFCKHRFVGVRMIQTCLRLLAPLLLEKVLQGEEISKRLTKIILIGSFWNRSII